MLHRDYYPPLLTGEYYHIFNRGNNKENLFYHAENYGYFLEKYKAYASPWLDTFAYCLLPNHFHLLVRVKQAEVFFSAKEFWKFAATDLPGFQNLAGLALAGTIQATEYLTGLTAQQEAEFFNACSAFISDQFRLLFMGYSKAINKQQGRTGSLFQKPFKRLAIRDEKHFRQLVYYIHANAQLHGICEDFREYPYSSYPAYLSTAVTKIEREEVISWFGTWENFRMAHREKVDLKAVEHLIIEEG